MPSFSLFLKSLPISSQKGENLYSHQIYLLTPDKRNLLLSDCKFCVAWSDSQLPLTTVWMASSFPDIFFCLFKGSGSWKSNFIKPKAIFYMLHWASWDLVPVLLIKEYIDAKTTGKFCLWKLTIFRFFKYSSQVF